MNTKVTSLWHSAKARLGTKSFWLLAISTVVVGLVYITRPAMNDTVGFAVGAVVAAMACFVGTVFGYLFQNNRPQKVLSYGAFIAFVVYVWFALVDPILAGTKKLGMAEFIPAILLATFHLAITNRRQR